MTLVLLLFSHLAALVLGELVIIVLAVFAVRAATATRTCVRMRFRLLILAADYLHDRRVTHN